MVLLPPDSPRRRDRGREEAARKQRARFARDVGDEHGQAWAHQSPRPRRSKFTLFVAAMTGPVGGPVTPDAGRVLSAPITLTGCRSAQTLATGPDATGTHEVALF